MKNNCVIKPKGAIETNVDSTLHKELLKRFPYKTNSNGGSLLYDRLFSDEFVNFFGQWFIDPDKPDTKKKAQEFYKNNYNKGFFNEHGEPKLITSGKESYFMNAKGEYDVINPNLLSEKNKMDLVNSLSALYFSSPKEDVGAFVEETLEKRYEVLESKRTELENKLDESKDLTFEEEEEIEIQIESLNMSLVLIEDYILTEPEVLKSIKSILKNKLKEFSLKYEEEVDNKEEIETNSGIAEFTKTSSETRDSNGIDSEIKAIISSIPDIQVSVDGEESFKYDEVLKMKMSLSANVVKNRLVELLSNIVEVELSQQEYVRDPYDMMINKLQEFQTQYNDPITREFLNKLNDLYESKSANDKEAFKTKFVTSFYLSQNIFTITEISTVDGVLTLRHVDPSSTQDKEAFLANEMIRSIFAKFPFYSGNTEIENNKEYEAIKKGLRTAKNKADIVKNLNKLGINLSPKTVNELYKNKENLLYGISENESKSPLNEVLNGIFSINISFQDSNTEEEVKLKGLKNIIEYYYTKADPSTKDKIIKRIKDKDYLTPISILAKYEAVNKVDLSDSSYFVGSKQRWMYSKMSGLNKLILGLKYGDTKALLNLEDRGFTSVNYLLANDVISNSITRNSDEHLKEQKRRISKLDLYLNSEIKKVNDSSPVLHNEIGEADMHMDMFFKLFNDQSTIWDNLGNQTNSNKVENNKENKRNIVVASHMSADKSTSIAFSGLMPNITNTVEVSTDDFGFQTLIGIGIKNREVVDGYLKGELKNIDKNANLIKDYLSKKTAKSKQEFLMRNLIPDYHYVTKVKDDEGNNVEYSTENMTITVSDKKGTILSIQEKASLDFRFINAGTWNKFGFFNSSMNKNQDEFDILFERIDGIKFPKANMSGHITDSIVSLVEKEIMEIAESNKSYFDQMIVGQEGESLFARETNIKGSTNESMVYDYIIASLFANIEMFSLFNGDLGFYKQKGEILSMEDALKRAFAPMTDGLYLRQSNKKNMSTYKSFNGKDVKIDKNKEIAIAVIENINIKSSRHQDGIDTGLNLKGESKGYEYELADAQGFGMPETHKELIGRIYGWTEADDAIHERLKDKNHKVTKEDIKWLKGSGRSNGPVKFTGFSMIPYYNENNDYVGTFPDYLKFSIAFLYPALINGTEVEYLSNAMNKQGVGIMLSKSGSKASNRQQTTIHNMKDGNFDGLKEDMILNPYAFPLSGLKLQVEMPTKFDKEGVVGNQHLKNLIANMNLDANSPGYNDKNYTYRGEKFTAKELFEKYNSTIINILQNQLNVAINKLGIVNHGNGKYSSSETKLRELIVAQLDESSDADLIEILKDESLPMETIPGIAQRAFPIISKYIHKNYGKVLTNSASAIQVANIGFDRVLTNKEQENQIIYLSEDKELRPPLPARVKDLTSDELKMLSEEDIKNQEAVVYFDEDGNPSLDKSTGKMRIKQARIMLPFASVFEKTGMSYEEFMKAFKEGKIDKEIFKRVVGYRIPNQSISSNDSIEIVGIMPPSMGDMAIVYHEITAKTGSDFDIDKLYLMMPNFRVSKEFVIPEENQKMIDSLKSQKIEVKPLAEYMRFKFENGAQILSILSRNDDVFNIIDKKEKEYKKKGEFIGPVKLLLESQKEIYEAFAKENKLIPYGEEFIDLQDIMNDLVNSYEQQSTEIQNDLDSLRESNKEVIKKIVKETGGFNGPVKSVDYISDNSDKGIQNQLIELMQSIMESPDTYNDLISPLDSTIVKDSINEVGYLMSISRESNFQELLKAFNDKSEKEKERFLKEFGEKRKLNPLQQMAPVGSAKTRVDMLAAKKLVATMANHMTDIPMSQIINQIIKFDIGIDAFEFGKTHVKGKELDDNFKLTKIVSYLMNAAVDAAKDNYIIAGNFNTYTANGAMVMVRMGIDPVNVFKVLMNEEVMALSRFKQLNTEKTTDLINTEYGQAKLNNHSESFVKFIQDNKMNFDDFVSNIVQKSKNYEEKSPEEQNEEDKVIEGKQLERLNNELILGFWNIVQLAGKELNNDITSSKSDSNGAGANVAAHTALYNKLRKTMKENIGTNINDNFVRGTKLYKDGISEEKLTFTDNIKETDLTFLGAMMNNSLFLANLVTKNMFIENTENYRQLINSVSSQLGNPLPSSEDEVKNLSKYIFPYVISQSGHSVYNLDESDVEDLMNNFSAEVIEKKQLNPDNLFLKELYIDPSTNLVSFPNFKFFDPNDKIVLREELKDIYKQRANGVAEGALFVHKLVRYAFLTTGFKPTYFNMNEYLPKSYFLNTGHARSVSRLIERLNNSDEFLESESIGKMMTFMIVNNEDDYKVVRNLKEKAIEDEGGNWLGNKNQIKSGVPIDDIAVSNYLQIENTLNFVPAVLVKESPKGKARKDKTKGYENRVYVLTRVDVVQMKDGLIERHPVYELINTNKEEVDTFANKANKQKTRIKLYDLNKIKEENLFVYEREESSILVQENIEYISPLTRIFKGNNLTVENDSVSLHDIHLLEEYNKAQGTLIKEAKNSEESIDEEFEEDMFGEEC